MSLFSYLSEDAREELIDDIRDDLYDEVKERIIDDPLEELGTSVMDDINEEYAQWRAGEWVSDSVIRNLRKLDVDHLKELAEAVMEELKEHL